MENTKKQSKECKKEKANETEEKKNKKSFPKNEGLNSSKAEKEESTLEPLEVKIYGGSKPKIQCVQCSKLEVKHKIYKCFSCGNFKCFNCASLDTVKTKQNIKGESYICDSCFNAGSKNRKKNCEGINYNQFLNPTSYLDKAYTSNPAINSKESQKVDVAENSIISDIQENNKTTTKNKFIGKKRYKESDIFDMSFIEKEAKNLDRILDIDKLHSQVPPPREIFTDTYKHENLYSLNREASAFRKSVRQKKPTPNNIVSIINCHQCKKIDVTTNILTCANDTCRESFCINCTKKYIKGSSISKFLKLKSTEENNAWVCFKCKDKCSCKTCKETRQNISINYDFHNNLNSISKERNSSEKKTNNLLEWNSNKILYKSKSRKYHTSYKKKLKSIKRQPQNLAENLTYPFNNNSSSNLNQNFFYQNNYTLNNYNNYSSSYNNTQANKKLNYSNMIITIPNIDLGFLSEAEAEGPISELGEDKNEKNLNDNENHKDKVKDIDNISNNNNKENYAENKKPLKAKKPVDSFNKTAIDSFLIYEVKEKSESEKTEYETIIDKEEQLILKDNKQYCYLVRAADEAEKFYFAAQNNPSEFDPADKACLFCSSQSIPLDSLLQFKTFEHFLAYLKFIMIFRRKLLMVNQKKFTRNLIEIFDFIDAYDERLRKKIYFGSKKFCCKFCLLSILNKTNLLFRVLSVIKLSLNAGGAPAPGKEGYFSNFNEEKALKVMDSRKINSSGNIRIDEDLIRSNSGKINLNAKGIIAGMNQNTLIDQIKGNSGANASKAAKLLNNNSSGNLNCNVNKVSNSISNSKAKSSQINSFGYNTIPGSVNGNTIKKPNQNLPNDLINFNDKPDSYNFLTKQQDNPKINLNKNSSLTPNNHINSNSNAKKILSSNNLTNIANKNANKINPQINNIENSSINGKISDLKFLSNPNNKISNSSAGLVKSNNANIPNNNNLNSKLNVDKSENKANSFLFTENSNNNIQNQKPSLNIKNFSILNNTHLPFNSINQNSNLNSSNNTNTTAKNNNTNNFNNNNSYNNLLNNTHNQVIFNSNPVSNGLNLNVIITKMLNIKRHFDSYYSLFSGPPGSSDPEKLKKGMVETNSLINDLLKHLNNFLDEVRKYSYYLSLVFTKTDKLKDSINEIFPHLEKIVSQIQLALQTGDDKLMNGLGVTLGHAICVNDLLRLCKFELNDVNKVKNYAKDNIVSEDVLRIFTVFLNLGKNQNFVNSLLGLFKNIKSTKAEDEEIDKENSNADLNANLIPNNNNTANNVNNSNQDLNKDEKSNVEYCGIVMENDINCNKKDCEGENKIVLQDVVNEKVDEENNKVKENLEIKDIAMDNYSSAVGNSELENDKNNDKKFDLMNPLKKLKNENDLDNSVHNKQIEEDLNILNSNDLIMKEENEDVANNPLKPEAVLDSNTNLLEITNKILFENNFGSPLLEVINKIGLLNKAQVNEEKTALEPEKMMAPGNNNDEIKIVNNDNKANEIKEEEKIELEINFQNESNTPLLNNTEKTSNYADNQEKENSILINRNFLEEEKHQLLENLKKQIEKDCIPCKVSDEFNSRIKDIKYENDDKIIKKAEVDSETITMSKNEITLKINKILDMDNAERDKMDIDSEFRDLDDLNKGINQVETSIEKMNPEFIENCNSKEIGKSDKLENKFNLNKTSNSGDLEKILDKTNTLYKKLENNKDKDNSINSLSDKDKDNIYNQIKQSSYHNKNINNTINSLLLSDQRKKEEIFLISNLEAKNNNNNNNNTLPPIGINNSLNQNLNPYVIFKSTKPEVSNNIQIPSAHGQNSNIQNPNINIPLYNLISNTNTNNFNINKNLSPQCKNINSKFYVFSNPNNSNNNNNLNNNEISKSKLSPENNQNLTPNNNNISNINLNNQIKSEEKKKVVLQYNDPDDSGNIQEHFNVNGQHDNIINDEPIKNTIFKPGFENLNETSSPRFYGNRSKNAQNIRNEKN